MVRFIPYVSTERQIVAETIAEFGFRASFAPFGWIARMVVPTVFCF
ncbi:Fumarate hydratase class II [Rhodopirellula islandica]|uniref:Fumarate hydratase class II n=1 Tax=Rhodopirellula islandica TaxID=595434 RepID=A0A0J1BBU5_RHOIS|nr:Fumarate hydratase class II [Rhodopirellula islandica]